MLDISDRSFERAALEVFDNEIDELEDFEFIRAVARNIRRRQLAKLTLGKNMAIKFFFMPLIVVHYYEARQLVVKPHLYCVDRINNLLSRGYVIERERYVRSGGGQMVCHSYSITERGRERRFALQSL